MAIDLNSLISTASKKLGIPEEKLRKAVNEGNVTELRSYLSDADNRKVDNAINNRKLTEDIQRKYMAGK